MFRVRVMAMVMVNNLDPDTDNNKDGAEIRRHGTFSFRVVTLSTKI